MRRTVLPALLLLLLGTLPCPAGEPPSDPLLRLDPSAHTTSIKGVVADAAGRFLVTASEDKTVRVWDTASGTLLSTLRPPIGVGNEGKLYAVAITPDASLVACAGWSQDDDIYLFNRASGALVKRLTGMGNVINNLAFSASGRFLAASLGGKSGVRLFRTSDGQLIGEDRDFADRSSSVNFAGDQRMVVASYDGFVRLYNVSSTSLTLSAKVQPPHGERPYAARFAPNGSLVAVGYRDSLRVSLLSGDDLSPQGEADTSGLTGGDMSSVAWSSDGRILFAGGTGKAEGKRIVRRWSEGGEGAFANLDAGAQNTIMDFAPLSDGRLAVATADPALTLLAADGGRLWQIGAPIADYRGLQNKIRLAADGTQLLFWYWDSQSLYRLNLAERTLTADADGTGLALATTSAPGLTIANWEDVDNPTLNDTPLKLQQYESSRSRAVAPGGTGFALGADWSLRYFSRSGEELWVNQVPGTCWAINITPDGRLVVASFGDGTIRWFRVRDGQELLAFFPHADRKRWVLWTPSGYYDASPGGEELIGWHVNHGIEQAADFFPAAQFRATYYRPDVIDRVLEALDESEALRMANAATGRKRQEVAIGSVLPPVVTIVSPADGSRVSQSEMSLRYSVRSPSGTPVTGVKVLIDGRPAPVSRGIDLKTKAAAAASGEEELFVTIPPRDCEVTLLAETASATSTPATVRLSWSGGAQPHQEAFVAQPKLYVLAVGVSAYADPSLKLGLAAKDAIDFAAALKQQQGGLYREVTTRVLTDAGATKDDILDGLEWLQKETTSRDVAAIFLAGHGVNDPSGIYYYLPQNADLERLKRTGVPFSDIKNTLASLAGKALFFVDTCHSGNAMGGRRAVSDINAVVNELSSAENGAVVFASSTGRQYSLEDPKWGNGAFTKALVEGLNGKADYTGKGTISVNMLDLYLSERVKELTGGKQTPTTTKPQTIQDFPIAVKR